MAYKVGKGTEWSRQAEMCSMEKEVKFASVAVTVLLLCYYYITIDQAAFGPVTWQSGGPSATCHTIKKFGSQ